MEISIIHNSDQLKAADVPFLEKMIKQAETEIPRLAKNAESNPELANDLRKNQILLRANYRLIAAIQNTKGGQTYPQS